MSDENNRYDWGGSQSTENSSNENSSSTADGGTGARGADYAFESVLKENGKPKSKGFSVAAMILGIVSVVACCSGWASLLLGIAAVVFAIISRKTLGYFDGMTIAGLILGIFGAVFGVFMIIGGYFLEEVFEEMFDEGFFDDIYEETPGPGGNTEEF